jgi:Spy/CpxP family protein refolding chaperone
MQISKLPLLALLALSVSATVFAQHSAYSGEENRTIKSLSMDDREALLNGEGWGLARAAELNGVPGPSHLLELADVIKLDPKQHAAITSLFESMQTQAIKAGKQFIAAEAALESTFQSGDITPEALRDHLATIAERRSNLRYIHLEAHLDALDIVTEEQVARYNAARGYSTSSACNDVPEGHDPAMWRAHQGC